MVFDSVCEHCGRMECPEGIETCSILRRYREEKRASKCDHCCARECPMDCDGR